MYQLAIHFKFILFVFLFSVVSGCTPIVKEKFMENESVNLNADAIAIIQVNHNREDEGPTKIFLQQELMNKEGKLVSPQVHKFERSAVQGENGFYILKLNALMNVNEYISLGPISVFGSEPSKQAGSWGEEIYTVWCHYKEGFAFKINEPGVYYLGNLTFKQNSKETPYAPFEYKIENNIKSAIDYLSKNYSNIDVSQIQEKLIQVLPVERRCVTTIYI